jgi:hypothetical protein
VTSGVTGARQLAAKLRAIGNAPTAAVRRKARGDALRPILVGAEMNLRANGSVITGKLLRGLRIVQTGRNETRFGQVGDHEPVAHLVEYGTAPHWQPNYRGGWMHPGARPYPFARPAFESHKDEAVKIYVQQLWKAIQAAAR